MKFLWYLTTAILATALSTKARHINSHENNAVSYGHGLRQPRIIPGAVAVKKLVLLKFKKVLPISLILLRSNNVDEAELLPVYATSEIPSDVQYIPTPDGIAGHLDVQAIAVPSALQQGAELQSVSDLKGIETLLSKAEENENGEISLTVGPTGLLNPTKGDEDDLLVSAVAEKPTQTPTSSTRNLTVENSKPFFKTQASIEEIPIYLYSSNNNKRVRKYEIKGRNLYEKPYGKKSITQ